MGTLDSNSETGTKDIYGVLTRCPGTCHPTTGTSDEAGTTESASQRPRELTAAPQGAAAWPAALLLTHVRPRDTQTGPAELAYLPLKTRDGI